MGLGTVGLLGVLVLCAPANAFATASRSIAAPAGLPSLEHGTHGAMLEAPVAKRRGRKRRVSDKEIKETLIAASIAAYDGSCPCLYNRTRNGSRCGRRSAYSRDGGEAPLCFSKDATAAMVANYRREHGLD